MSCFGFNRGIFYGYFLFSSILPFPEIQMLAIQNEERQNEFV